MHRLSKIALVAAVMSVAAGVFLFTPWLTVLTLAETKTGRILLMLDGNAPFTLSYRHSFNRGMVVESYQPGPDGNILLTGATFENFGAGIPEDSRLRGSSLSAAAGRSLRDLLLFIGTEAGHTLTLGGRVIPLRELAPPQTSVRISLGRMSLVEFLWRQLHG